MRIGKEAYISIFVAAIVTALGSAVLASGLTNMADYVWIFFAGFTITTGSLHGLKQISNLVCSHAAGWVWAMFMFYCCLFVVNMTGSLSLGFFVCIFLGSVVMLVVHIGFTMQTWFNVIPVMYGTIFCWFAIKDFHQVIYIVAAFLAGGILSTVSDEIQDKILKRNE